MDNMERRKINQGRMTSRQSSRLAMRIRVTRHLDDSQIPRTAARAYRFKLTRKGPPDKHRLVSPGDCPLRIPPQSDNAHILWAALLDHGVRSTGIGKGSLPLDIVLCSAER